MPELSHRVRGIVPSGKTGWEIHFAALTRKQAGEDLLMLTAGDHDFPTPAATVAACEQVLREGHHHYTQLEGIPALRRAMARVSAQCTGVETVAEQILATGGGQGALYAAVQAVCDAGDHGVVVGPYYATYPGTFNAAGARYTVVDALPENGFEPDVGSIEAALQANTRAILINTPNNPTGAVYSRQTIEQLCKLCCERDLWLISDEVYWTHTAGTPHVSPRALPGMAERTLVVNSMSKSHGMTGWRVGWLTGPQRIIAPLIGLNLVSTYGLNDFVSHAAAEALDNDWGVAEIAATYDERRGAFLEAIAGAEGMEVRGSQGGMYVVLDVRAISADGNAFAWDVLEREKLAVMPGESFGEATAGHIRISLCSPVEVLQEAAFRLKRYVSAQLAAA